MWKVQGGVDEIVDEDRAIEERENNLLFNKVDVASGDAKFVASSISGSASVSGNSYASASVKGNNAMNANAIPQHGGIGKLLMCAAESIARRYRWPQIAVISGVGVRNYYRKLGYGQRGEGRYLIKDILHEDRIPGGMDLTLDWDDGALQKELRSELAKVCGDKCMTIESFDDMSENALR